VSRDEIRLGVRLEDPFRGALDNTSGRKFNVTRLSEPEGVVPQDTSHYVVGLDFTLPRDTRLNLQCSTSSASSITTTRISCRTRNWRLTFGVDVFDGPVIGLFGRFAGNDRVYLATRYDF
jgi:hypothetical protein